MNDKPFQSSHSRTLSSPSTKHKVNFPFLKRTQSTTNETLVEYTNFYVNESQPPLKIYTPILRQEEKHADTVNQHPSYNFNDSTMELMENDSSKEQEWHDQTHNSSVMKSLRKYMPRNSSLASGLRENPKFLKLRQKIHRNSII
jgi:hypothetical protein